MSYNRQQLKVRLNNYNDFVQVKRYCFTLLTVIKLILYLSKFCIYLPTGRVDNTLLLSGDNTLLLSVDNTLLLSLATNQSATVIPLVN